MPYNKGKRKGKRKAEREKMIARLPKIKAKSKGESGRKGENKGNQNLLPMLQPNLTKIKIKLAARGADDRQPMTMMPLIIAASRSIPPLSLVAYTPICLDCTRKKNTRHHPGDCFLALYLSPSIFCPSMDRVHRPGSLQ